MVFLVYFPCSSVKPLLQKLIHSTYGKEFCSWSSLTRSFFFLDVHLNVQLVACCFYFFLESWNHRMVCIARNLKDHLVQSLCQGWTGTSLVMSWSGKHNEFSFFPCNSQSCRFLPHTASAVLLLIRNLFYSATPCMKFVL